MAETGLCMANAQCYVNHKLCFQCMSHCMCPSNTTLHDVVTSAEAETTVQVPGELNWTLKCNYKINISAQRVECKEVKNMQKEAC